MAKGFTKIINKLQLSKILMTGTIVLIAAFQYYWISRLYNEEWDGLKKQSDLTFRDVMYKLQLQRFRKDTTIFKNSLPDNLFAFDVIDSVKGRFMDSQVQRIMKKGGIKLSISMHNNDEIMDKPFLLDSVASRIESLNIVDSSRDGPAHFIKYFSNRKLISTSFDTKTIDSAYKIELLKSNIDVPFTIITTKQLAANSSAKPGQLQTNIAYVGLSRANGYVASFNSPVGYLINKIKLPVIFALLLMCVTIVSFVFLYRNLLEQRKLAEVKNEFISNITHELKTPIATVNVAIEALRNFNALQNPERTKEYLDISALELQRLSMLVDKVLKLSMFENKEIELNKETIDLHQLAAEVIASMKLQFDKAGAFIQLSKDGSDFFIKADKLHITSVLFNLLDNALKYSKDKPAISIHLFAEAGSISLTVADNGIGIPAGYRDKIFEKFFRVPSGDHHNIKGYGLGLSYVRHIIVKHHGTISVESTEGKGSTFTIKLPKQ